MSASRVGSLLVLGCAGLEPTLQFGVLLVEHVCVGSCRPHRRHRVVVSSALRSLQLSKVHRLEAKRVQGLLLRRRRLLTKLIRHDASLRVVTKL